MAFLIPLPSRPYPRPVALPRASWRGRARWFAVDIALVAAVMALYFLGRGLAPTRIDASVSLSQQLVSLERALHIFHEPAIQQFSIRYHWMQELANFTYAYLHFPVMGVVGVWVWWHAGRERFAFVRTALFISMAIGLVFYYLLPAAPPRLLAAHGYDLGFVDTVFGGNTAVRYAQPSLILNEYAAIPSFHFGWIAFSAAVVWTNTGSRTLRGLALALVLLMTWAIVASANHFFIDMALGGVVVAVSWALAARLMRRPRPRLAPVPVALAPVPAPAPFERCAA